MMLRQNARGRAMLVLTAAGLAAGCADYGDGGGHVDAGVGYGGRGYYADPYYGDGYGYGAAYGYGYGWYGDYYYPGTGFYVFDRGGHRHRWSDDQRRYWEARRDARDRREDRGVPDRGRRWAGRARTGDRPPAIGDVPPAGLDATSPADRSAFRARREAGVRAGAAPGGERRETFRERSGTGARTEPPAPRAEPRARGGGAARGERVQEQ